MVPAARKELGRDSPVVLLGAGVSQEAGVPTTFDMTESLVQRVSQNQSALHPTVQALNFVCGALLRTTPRKE